MSPSTGYRGSESMSGRFTRRTLLRGAAFGLAAGGTFAAFGLRSASAQEFDPYWVQSTQKTQLWSGPGPAAEPFIMAPAGSYFMVVQAQAGPRLYVWNPATENYCYVDALAVGPVDDPPPPEAIVRRTLWVATSHDSLLWSDIG